MSLYLQYGCGMDAPKGWVNYDASPTLFFERIPWLGRLYTKNKTRFPKNARWGDIVRGLPHEHGSVQGIFCSHVLEHLSLEDMRIALRNTHALLCPGGIFRLVVPDLERAICNYQRDRSPRAALQFMEETFLGEAKRMGILQRIKENVLGRSKHLWMWDEKSLSEELRLTGFRKIRRVSFGDSEDPHFEEVENKTRFENCLAIEAAK